MKSNSYPISTLAAGPHFEGSGYPSNSTSFVLVLLVVLDVSGSSKPIESKTSCVILSEDWQEERRRSWARGEVVCNPW